MRGEGASVYGNGRAGNRQCSRGYCTTGSPASCSCSEGLHLAITSPLIAPALQQGFGLQHSTAGRAYKGDTGPTNVAWLARAAAQGRCDAAAGAARKRQAEGQRAPYELHATLLAASSEQRGAAAAAGQRPLLLGRRRPLLNHFVHLGRAAGGAAAGERASACELVCGCSCAVFAILHQQASTDPAPTIQNKKQ